MKTLEIFLDESGDITRDRPMNISGIAVLSPGPAERDAFHSAYFHALEAAGLTAGVCDAVAGNDRDAGQIADQLQAPKSYVPKRPIGGQRDEFWAMIQRVAEIAEDCARANRVSVMACSLQFPASTDRRWGTADPKIDLLLDRPYGECLKDVLELLLFETPRVRQAIVGNPGCTLAFDLPTRTLGTPVDAANQNSFVTDMWSQWGVQARADANWETRQPEVAANTLEPADGIEILTAALNRRKDHSVNVQVDRARCCKLVTWSQWEYSNAQDQNKRRNKRYWAMASSPRPKQIHFLADFLSNGLFNNRIRPNQDPYRIWFDRGFMLSSVDESADEWLAAVRAFANGNRVEAMLEVGRICTGAQHSQSKTFQFFRRSAKGWPRMVAGSELQDLFRRIGMATTRPAEPSRVTGD